VIHPLSLAHSGIDRLHGISADRYLHPSRQPKYAHFSSAIHDTDNTFLQDTLKYGSGDAGGTIHNADETLSSLMKEAAVKMNIKVTFRLQ